MGVERTDLRALFQLAKQAGNALLHFSGGFVRESDRENSLRPRAVLDEIGDAERDDARLAAASAREDQHWPGEGLHRFLLCGVEGHSKKEKTHTEAQSSQSGYLTISVSSVPLCELLEFHRKGA